VPSLLKLGFAIFVDICNEDIFELFQGNYVNGLNPIFFFINKVGFHMVQLHELSIYIITIILQVVGYIKHERLNVWGPTYSSRSWQ
jgi:hypothetical protein